jgi:hypothetical protein
MSVGESSGSIHDIPTRKSGYRYLFYDKHHGAGGHDAAQWLISRDEEFRVFDLADEHDLADDRQWLYGIGQRDADGRNPTSEPRASKLPNSRSPATMWPGTVIRCGL